MTDLELDRKPLDVLDQRPYEELIKSTIQFVDTCRLNFRAVPTEVERRHKSEAMISETFSPVGDDNLAIRLSNETILSFYRRIYEINLGSNEQRYRDVVVAALLNANPSYSAEIVFSEVPKWINRISPIINAAHQQGWIGCYGVEMTRNCFYHVFPEPVALLTPTRTIKSIVQLQKDVQNIIGAAKST